MPKNASLNSLDSAPRISRSHLMSKVSEKPNGSNSASLPQNQLNQSRNIQRFCCLGMLVVFLNQVFVQNKTVSLTKPGSLMFHEIQLNITQSSSISVDYCFHYIIIFNSGCHMQVGQALEYWSTGNHVSSLPSRCPPNRRGWQASARKAWTCCCWHDVPLLQCDQWKPYRHGAGISVCW